ncbi:MAG: AHH domain-containing protein [Novosphingobium sp.]
MSSAPPRVRNVIPFRAVNRPGDFDYDNGLQRHHILPRQLLTERSFGSLFDTIGRERIGFDDFRTNGLLLPANDIAAVRIGLPLHRGPHRNYNELVIARVGQIEASWSTIRARSPEAALAEALMRLSLLQKTLRRRLLNPLRDRFVLNRSDPFSQAFDFAELDDMADALWPETDAIQLADEASLTDTSR